MKMIRAILRPEAADAISDSLAAAGFDALTKVPVFGRGKQKGITVGAVHYDELPKTMLMMVVQDQDADRAADVIKSGARTGNFGDGKIFVTGVERTYTIRTGSTEL